MTPDKLIKDEHFFAYLREPRCTRKQKEQDTAFLTFLLATTPPDLYPQRMQAPDGTPLGYRLIIGPAPHIAFVAHLDTVIRSREEVNTRQIHNNTNGIITATDKNGPAVLGADDGAGVYVLLNMIRHRIPGEYLFFYDEESGAHPSATFAQHNMSAAIELAIQFDRRGQSEVIIAQGGTTLCAPDVGNLIAQALAPHVSLDISYGGVFTDTANFKAMCANPHCVNISVGYEAEHTRNECLDFNYLKRLTLAAIEADWDTVLRQARLIEAPRESAWDYPDEFDTPQPDDWILDTTLASPTFEDELLGMLRTLITHGDEYARAAARDAVCILSPAARTAPALISDEQMLELAAEATPFLASTCSDLIEALAPFEDELFNLEDDDASVSFLALDH